jgi:NADH dehydrogenase FAD-containing subunit
VKGYLVVGGGVVGVELAGELASAAPGKTVRLAHRGSRLMEGLAPRASAVALKHLAALGVEVLLNTADARPLAGEVVYETVSPEVNTGFLPPELLDSRGRVAVGPGLQVTGRPTWYALGDASAVDDPKHGANAAAQGAYVAAHLLAGLAASPRPVKPYPTGKLLAVVPIGRTHGLAQLPFGVVTWKFLVNLKRKDFFVGRYRREFGADRRS